MGFKRKTKHYRLVFDDYEGFECVMGSLSVDEFIEITRLSNALVSADKDPDDVGRVFDILAAKIIRWNLEDDDGEPVLHTPEQLHKEDFDFIQAIQVAWMSAMAGVPAPLPSGLNSGVTSPADMTNVLANMSQSHQS